MICVLRAYYMPSILLNTVFALTVSFYNCNIIISILLMCIPKLWFYILFLYQAISLNHQFLVF